MTRSSALGRLVFGVVYLPLYYFVLYPLVFFIGVVVAALDIAFAAVTGKRLNVKPLATTKAWESISQGVTWVFSGRTQDKPGWVP